MGVRWFVALFFALAVMPPSWAAQPPPGSISITAPGEAAVMTVAEIAKLPAIQIKISFGTDHGPLHASFTGPLLWTVLNAAHAIDQASPKAAVRDYVLVTGSDGYTAVLALAEIAPAFENKQVILAETMNGKPLGPGHLRVVVPGDARGGRSVRDVVSIAVLTPPA